MPSPEWPSDNTTILDLHGKQVGRYKITRLVGHGGMGEVYRAEDPLLKRTVALKRVAPHLRKDPQYRDLLLKEAERASKLTNDRIALIHDVVEDHGELFVVMEFVEGATLRSRIGKPMPLPEFHGIATQCLEALEAAHHAGIIHRDIKPENIMITPAGRVKICDFGLAYRSSNSDSSATNNSTQFGTFRGTPGYMAPEVLLEQGIDARSDLFALGIVFYELLTGLHPFRLDGNHAATINRIINEQPRPLVEVASIPDSLSSVIQRMLAKSPDARFSSAREILSVLGSSPSAPRNANRLVLVAAAVLLIVMFAAIFWIGRSTQTRIATPGKIQGNLVVIPFRAIGAVAETQPYSDGLTETVTARLARLADSSDFSVAPASEVRARNISTAEDAKKLFGASFVLTGTMNKIGSIVRVSYELYDAATLKPLKSDVVNADASDPFALEDRIVDILLETFQLHTSPAVGNMADRPSVKAAYDHYLRGRGYLQNTRNQDNVEAGISALKLALDADPSYALAYASLGEAYWAKFENTRDQQWLEAAQRACDQSLSINPKSAEANVCAGTVAQGRGKYEDAMRRFNAALDVDPTSDNAYRGLGRAQENLGKKDDAEQTYRRAVQLKPRFFLGYVRLGEFYFRQGRYEESLDQFKKQTELLPDSERAFRSLGAVYIRLDENEKAITALEKSNALRPNYEAYSNLGAVYLRTREFDKATTYFQEATKILSTYVTVGNLARAYYWSGQRDRAKPNYEEAIALGAKELAVNPRNADVHILLSRYHAALGHAGEAMDHLKQALALRPDQPEYHFIAADVHNRVGKYDDTVAALRKAVSLGYSKGEISSSPEFDNLRSKIELKQLLLPEP